MMLSKQKCYLCTSDKAGFCEAFTFLMEDIYVQF